MPKTIRTNQAIERPAGNSNTYEVIPEGTYFGVVRSVKWSEFTVKAGYTMEKFTPVVELLNSNHTRIDRQDLTIGAVDENGFYTNKYFSNAESSVIFGGADVEKGNYGARNFMFAMGMLNNDGVVVFNELALVDVVVKVRVKTRTYTWKNQVRHENVIAWWDMPTAKDMEALLEADIDTSEWVAYNLCVKEATHDDSAQHSLLVFETQQAFDIFWETMFTDTDEWQHPTGVLGADDPDTFFSSWGVMVYGDGTSEEDNTFQEDVAVPQDAGDDIPM